MKKDDISIYEKVKDILSKILGVSKEVILPIYDLVSDYGLDSIDIEQLKQELETEFGIDIQSQDFSEKRNIYGICDYVEELLQEKASCK